MVIFELNRGAECNGLAEEVKAEVTLLFLFLLFLLLLLGLFLLLISSGGGSGCGDRGGGDSRHLLLTGGDQLIDVLALDLLEEGLELGVVDLTVGGLDDGGDLLLGGLGLAGGDGEHVGSDVLHLLSLCV